jgi:hypothetical protein
LKPSEIVELALLIGIPLLTLLRLIWNLKHISDVARV